MTDDERGRKGTVEGVIAPDVAGEGMAGPSPTALPDGPVLVVAAHPDDADIGCGGAMARLVAEGRYVVAAVVTDGSEGGDDPSVPDEELRDRRERERLVRALAAAKGNKAEAARALGLARSTLVSRLRKHGLQ